MMHRIAQGVRRILHEIQALFITGILTLLPVVLTAAALIVCMRVVSGWVQPIRAYEPGSLQAIRFSEYGVILLIIIAVGAITRFIVFRYLIEFFEMVVKKIPLVRHVYFGTKQLGDIFTATGEKAQHHRPVLIEFPRAGMYSIGFVTGSVGTAWSPNSESWISVFVPTTPNPTTGFYLIVRQNECKQLSLTRQEAIALIISGGVLQPDSLTSPRTEPVV